MFNKRFLSSKEFAILVGISAQNATKALRRCHSGETWRGAALVVVKDMAGAGRGGLSYLVDKESVPLNFIKLATENKETTTQDITYRSLSVSIPPNNDSCIVGDLLQEIPPKIPKKDRHYHKDKVDFKMGIVKRVLQSTDHNTPERALLIRELAAKERYPFGAKRGQYVGKNTIRRWLSEYENKGLTAICRKRRTDSGQSRVIISRAWDNEVKKLGLTDNEIQKMAVSLKRHIASLWRSGTPSVPTIQLNALPFAVNQIMQKGCTLSKEELTHICELPQKLIQRESHYKAVNTYRQDAARSAAIQTPRIKRSRDHLKPMEWVAGDVHHIDIAFKRDDGSNCTIKAVAWLDLATNRAFITPFLMPKGEMIRREHVIESFVSMCEHSNWGVPTKLYLDRGGEYNWGEFVEDLCRLKRSIEIHDLHDLDEEDSTGVQRSRAYNPQSKVIETLFAALEKSIFSQIQGYIGGNRMQKKTENQGKSPKPYDGDLESFKATLHTVLAYYHHKKQNGHLKGKSPNQAFEESINAGWKSLLLDSSELEVAFCKKVFREVRAGGVFMWDNQEYRHDALIAMAGNRKVLVGAPLFGNKNRLYLWNEEEEPIGLAEPVKSFSFDDIKGSGEQKRQNSVLNKQIRQMESDTDKLDLEKIMSEVIEVMGAEPKAESKGVVSIDSHHRYLANEAQKKPALTPDDEYIENRRRQSALLEGLAQKLKVANGE